MALLAICSCSLTACGDDSDDDGPSYDGLSDSAWMITIYESGSQVDVVITFDTEQTGTFRMCFSDRMQPRTFTYTRSGNLYSCHMGGDVFTIEVNGSTAVYSAEGYQTVLTKTSLKDFYQDWYDSEADKVRDRIDELNSGQNRYPDLVAQAAKNAQDMMRRIRQYAENDGVTIEESYYETVEIRVPGSPSNSSEWQRKYDDQVEVVKGYYYEYQRCSNRFEQVVVKDNYESAQRQLTRIRTSAAREGVYIEESEWESKRL